MHQDGDSRSFKIFRRQDSDEIRSNRNEEAARAAYFLSCCEAVPATVVLPELLLEESLVARVKKNPFYLLLIERSPGLTSTDRMITICRC